MRMVWVVSFLCSLLLACSDDSASPPREAGGPNPDGMKPDTAPPAPKNLNPAKPAATTKLVFVHHSVGEDWGRPDGGNLRAKLNENNYYVADTNYEWGPADLDVGDAKIGDHTDIGHWSNWFLGPHRDTYLTALYTSTHVTDSWGTNALSDPGGENTVVLFKS